MSFALCEKYKETQDLELGSALLTALNYGFEKGKKAEEIPNNALHSLLDPSIRDKYIARDSIKLALIDGYNYGVSLVDTLKELDCNDPYNISLLQVIRSNARADDLALVEFLTK